MQRAKHRFHISRCDLQFQNLILWPGLCTQAIALLMLLRNALVYVNV